MTAFSEPTKWAQALGATANADVIPDEAGATDVDISKIFPAVFSVPLSQGGKAIPRRTLNGIFKTLGDWSFYGQNGGVPSYNADFDYTVGRFVSYSGRLYRCIQDNVHTAPHNPTDKDFWAELSDSSSSTGLLPNQIIISPVPMSDANLHLLDGSLLTSGVYADYVAMMIRLYNADPTASCWISESDWQTSVSTYGECGKFVVDTVNETVRLPKLTSFIQATSIASELGSLTEAGLPNVTGVVSYLATYGDINQTTGAFSWLTHGTAATSVTSNYGYRDLALNLSRSNPIYKDNFNKVQPQSIKYYYYIVVGTVSKTPVQVDIDSVATDLNGKADRSLSNVDNTGNILMAHNAMPSHTKDTLTLGASGATYTAPADGYFTIHADIQPSGKIDLATLSATTSLRGLYQLIKGGPDYVNHGSYIPVKKGDSLQIVYDKIGSVYEFSFVYAVGSESEQQ